MHAESHTGPLLVDMPISSAATGNHAMNTALVPYQPRARDPAGARAGFADFLRRGGRPRGVPLGDFPDREDVENPKQDFRDPEVAKILRVQGRQACATQCAILVALGFAILVFVLLGVVVSRVNDSIVRMDSLIAPHATSIVNSTVELMSNMGSSMLSVKQITKMTSDLAAKDLGPTGAASVALNSTAVIAERLARFMEHPVMQLSLGGDQK